MIDAMTEIRNYTARETLISFKQNNMLNNAVLFQFSVTGEAINHIEGDILGKYDYPWHKVRSFRNLVAHEYFNIKLEAVWKIVELELPALQKKVEQILKNEF